MKKLNLFLSFTLLLIGVNSWTQSITRYEMYSNHVQLDKYTSQYKRAFDDKGIITQKNQYHPLTIAFYGILSYDQFKVTGDSSYYYKVIDQAKYFDDSSKFDFKFNGKGIGLPYKFKFHDLKPTWYSGMSQGVALSFLLRHHELTKSETSLKLAEKIAYFMLQPVSEGGTISKTQEGFTWIEEYPNSKSSKQVLNGFVNGLVGLKEYCDFFPKDTMAARIHSEAYESFLNTVSNYDTEKWTHYNRNRKKISKAYLRYQIAQMDHLHTIYGDEKLRKQMRIWAMMMNSTIDKEMKFYRNPNYVFSKKLERDGPDSKIYRLDEYDSFINGFRIDSTVRVGKKIKKLSLISGKAKATKSLILKFNTRHSFVKVFSLNKMKTEKMKAYSTKNGRVIKEIDVMCMDNLIMIKSDEAFDEVLLKEKTFFKKSLKVHEIRSYNYKSYKAPMFAHLKYPEKFKLQADSTYNVLMDKENVYDLVVFYKYGNNDNELNKAKWTYGNSLENPNSFIPEKTGMYKFFISYRVLSPNSSIADLEFVNN